MKRPHVVPFLAALLVSCLMVSPALAQNKRIPSSVGVDYLSFDYEHETPNGITEHGNIFGVRTRQSWRMGTNWTTHLEAYLLSGWTDAHGNLFTGPVNDDPSAQGLMKLQWNVGYAFDGPEYSVVPYSGLGGRAWSSKIDGPNGYTRTTTYTYLPVGLYFSGIPAEGYRIGPVFKLEYRELVSGNVEHSLEDVGLSTVDTALDNGHGFSFSVEGHVDPLTKIEGYVELWDIGASESKTVGARTAQEPSNETTMIGVSVGYAF